jgi:GPH family glycoside/pentoside/hexuronide:cation symporter
MMGDAIDYNEWKTGKREEGTVYSLHSFFRKLAQGIGPAVALIIMTSLGYANNAVLINGEYFRPEEVGQVASAINVAWLDFSVAINLRVLVAVLFLVSALFQFIGLVLVYNLDKKTLDKMQAELSERSKLKTEPVFVEEQVEGADESQQE